MPMEPVNYHSKLVKEPFRRDIKPLHITQPLGPSFEVQGNLIKWQKWNVRIIAPPTCPHLRTAPSSTCIILFFVI